MKPITLFPRAKLLTVALIIATLAGCGGGSDGAPDSRPDDLAQPNTGKGGRPDTHGSETPTGGEGRVGAPGSTPVTPPGVAYEPLLWPSDLPLTQYRKSDGTLVTNVGGRVRDRHARENVLDNYNIFAPHYFEKRTHDITIYDNEDPQNPGSHILTVVIRPQWWLFDLNFRHGYMGFLADKNKYNDNSNAYKLLSVPSSGGDIKTPIANYESLPGDPRLTSGAQDYTPRTAPPGKDYVIVKEIRNAANALDASNAIFQRPLKAGDLVEFELGVFLAGEQSIRNELGIPNRFNYYSDALVYQVGSTGVRPWMQRGGNDTFSFLGAIHPMSLWPAVIPLSAQLGGDMTLQEDTSSDPARRLMQVGSNVAGYNIQPWVEGRRLFHTSFLTGAHLEENNPVFTQQANKVGPRLQQTRCVACHVSDGKSSPLLGAPLNMMGVFVANTDSQGQQVPESRFGTRLRMGQVTDYADEARRTTKTIDGRQAVLSISGYSSISGSFLDGTSYSLKKPLYNLTYPDGSAATMPTILSVRAAPHLTGMGLLEAVPETQLEAIARSQPADVAGRLQIVADPARQGVFRVGRFGWKGGAPTVEAQVSFALNDDMAVTTPLRPTLGCSYGGAGATCRKHDAAANGIPALSSSDVDLLTRYVQLLGVPSQRAFADPTSPDPAGEAKRALRVNDGEQLFRKARCAECHTPTLKTGDHRLVELRNQMIHPFTDLLLHDMGPDLADGYTEGVAKGSEWRTAPLWGIGLQASINPDVRYMHDGRARTLEEAILWHGGQGSASRNAYLSLSREERDKLLEYLRSL